jgi:hypothetical protein
METDKRDPRPFRRCPVCDGRGFHVDPAAPERRERWVGCVWCEGSGAVDEADERALRAGAY